MVQPLGYVISGSLTEGFLVRIASDTALERIKAGKFVVINGGLNKFFSLITDVRLEVTNPDILLFPPSAQETLLQQILKKKDMYATALIKPMVMLNEHNHVGPVKTIPSHFAPVCDVNDHDVALIFGDESQENGRYFHIGKPLDMTTPVCMDLDRLVERSNGIFGKTGTGKTFITRLVLAGLIKNERAVNLIFDMHSEYGLQARKEGKTEGFVKGLKTLFPDKVAIFSLDPDATRRRGATPDVAITIPYNSVHVDDVLSLQDELNLHATAVEAAYLIAAKYKKDWLEVLLVRGEQAKEFAQEIGAHPESIAALYRKIKRIERLPFFVTSAQTQYSVVDQMMEYLERGINVVVEFGNHTATFVYLLIANIITRRVHAAYVARTEKFLASQAKSDEPKKLLITIEEAHKFLNPSAAQQTIFGTIAREMRKYYVSLLVVDQRPSGIDPEVLSQIGTKLVAQLSDEKDISAVLTGAANGQGLKAVLASLESKQQVLLLGHAVTMPIVVETREYNQEFYAAMAPVMQVSAKQLIDEIF